MIMFLLTFFLLYGGIHAYAFFKAESIFHFSAVTKALLIFLLILLIFAPLFVRMAESRHLEESARVIAYIGYIWMAFIFFFFFINVFLEVFRWLLHMWNSSFTGIFYRYLTFGLAVLISTVLVIYGYIDAKMIRVKSLEIKTDHVLPEGGKIRIVQISDVHVGIIIRGERLQAVIDLVKEARPDILVSTGDLLDGELDNVMQEAASLAAIEARYGKFAILGNHEYYAGLERSIEFIRAAGFRLLRDEEAETEGVAIMGADDITGRRAGLVKRNAVWEKALAEKRQNFVLFLQHQPYLDDRWNFNLQLSGHTHGGQLYPFGLIVRLFFENIYGFHELSPGKALYVSRGTGTWGPPVRVFAPPEMTVIDLIGKK